MKRAIVVYLENKQDLLLMFNCLYTSLKYIQSTDTDLVVFGTQESLNKIPDDCIKKVCAPITYKPEWHNHHYMNSLYCLVCEESDFLDGYDFLLRCDLDTFLTPAWNSYYPDSYSVGEGSYVHYDEVRQNIRRIASRLGFRHQGIHNIGSTHYGKPSQVRQVCRLALPITKYILNQEFIDGPGEWPKWYKWVSILYGTEIAVNHLIEDIQIDYGKLDYLSTSEDSIRKHPHIHCWHTEDCFSKFQFAAGTYDGLDMNVLDIDKVKDYCLFIALKSKLELPL